MRKVMRWIFSLAVALLMTGCGEAENEFTLGVCYFAFDNALYQDATLASAMNVNAPGLFCIITKELRSGATCFDFTNSAGVSSSTPMITSVENRRTLVLGYNNGIIVGYGSMSVPAVFYAFDRQCPNCFHPNTIPIKNYPLSFKSNGIVECKVCHRQYDLNNDGFVASGDDGQRLTRYRASCMGPFGMLLVN